MYEGGNREFIKTLYKEIFEAVWGSDDPLVKILRSVAVVNYFIFSTSLMMGGVTPALALLSSSIPVVPVLFLAGGVVISAADKSADRRGMRKGTFQFDDHVNAQMQEWSCGLKRITVSILATIPAWLVLIFAVVIYRLLPMH